MNNKPVAWMNIHGQFNKKETWLFPIPLYTQDQLEEARKLGMQQERALWNLSESTQEIMNTYPVKELTINITEIKRTSDQSIQIVFTSCRSASEFVKILRKAQEK